MKATARSHPQRRQIAAVAALSVLILAGNILYAGCAMSPDRGPIVHGIERAATHVAMRRSTPEPESEWNASKLWVKVASGPALYVPRAYGSRIPPATARGEWFEDSRDKKKLFVPKGGAGGLSEGVLRGEAIKITLWYSKGSFPGVSERALPQHYPH